MRTKYYKGYCSGCQRIFSWTGPPCFSHAVCARCGSDLASPRTAPAATPVEPQRPVRRQSRSELREIADILMARRSQYYPT